MAQDTTQKPNYTVPLIILTSLFFLFGFITTMSNSLIGFLKDAFATPLSETEAMFVNLSVYGAYIISIPVGWLIKKIGYKAGVLVGLAVIAVGYILFYPATTMGYTMFLIALLIVASGVVLLQVAANPYVIALGSPETSSSRLVMAQSLNSVGTVIAPLFVSMLILTEASKAQGATSVQIPFLFIAAFTIVLTGLLYFIKLPVIKEDDSAAASAVQVKSSVWAHKNMILGALGIFMYMGVEVGVPSFFVKYSGFDSTQATNMLAIYWGGMLLGRFSGIFILKKFDTAKVIGLYAIVAASLLAGSLLTGGMLSVILILATGLFHSIMWPSIFNLAITDLGPYTKQASGIICTAVIGGGILLLLQGAVADAVGVKISMTLLFAYYAYILFFALKGSKMR